MKIIRVCYEFPEPWDGLTQGPFEITKEQLRLGYDITYIHGGKKKDNKIDIFGLKRINLGPVLPTWLFGPLFSFNLKIIKEINLLYRNNKIIDVIHFHGYTAIWFAFLRYLGCYKNIMFIYHVHSSGLRYFSSLWRSLSIFAKFKALFIWPFYLLQDYLVIKTADKIISVSKNELESFKKISNDIKKLHIVENGVNTEIFKPSDNKKTKKTKLIYVGKIIERKNILLLLEVASNLLKQGVNFELTLVGNGPKKFEKYIQTEIEKKSLVNTINWIRYLNQKELADCYKNHDTFIILSKTEGFPKVILEAASSGLRIISSRSFDTNSLLDKYINWVENPEDIEEVCKIISNNKIINNIDEIRKSISWVRKVEIINKIYLSY